MEPKEHVAEDRPVDAPGADGDRDLPTHLRNGERHYLAALDVLAWTLMANRLLLEADRAATRLNPSVERGVIRALIALAEPPLSRLKDKARDLEVTATIGK